MSTLY